MSARTASTPSIDPYWDRVAETAVFSLPLDTARLRDFVDRTARILDYGCGYGRQLVELRELGYSHLAGIDASSAMVERARREVPGVPISLCGALPCEHPADSFDAVLLSAVLTCVPGDEDQHAILREVHRLLRPGGVLFLSDFLLHSDARNQSRYADGLRRFGTHGVFAGPGGATMRHHDPEHILMLTRGFESIYMAPFAATTMNGNSATGVLYIGHEPAAGSTAD